MPPKVKDYSLEDDDSVLDDIEDIDDEGQYVEVTTPSGATIYLLNDHEAEFYQKIAGKYEDDYKFQNVSDLRDLDRLLELEAMCHRLSVWGLRNSTYDGGVVPANINKEIRDFSKEIRELKANLGIDKRTRDAGQGETIADKWAFVCEKAKEFGYHRNEQIIEAYNILNELRAKITLYENSTETERNKFNANLEDIIEWAKEQFEEFDKIIKSEKEAKEETKKVGMEIPKIELPEVNKNIIFGIVVA